VSQCRKQEDAVPFAGEIMVSRWAFEALAVEQFKGNDYMKYFFDSEKEMAQSLFCSDILITELTGQADLINGWLRQNRPAADISHKLLVISNEIGKLDSETPLPRFQHYNDLVIEKYNHETAGYVKSHLAGLKDYYDDRYKKIRAEKDRLINSLNKEKGNNYLYDLKMKSHNNSLEKLVLNSEIKEFFRETPCGIMQKIAPVYKVPDFKNGRAHFLASQKNLFGIIPGTPVFNLAVIWLMSVFLYLSLYYDWLRRIISVPSKVIKKG